MQLDTINTKTCEEILELYGNFNPSEKDSFFTVHAHRIYINTFFKGQSHPMRFIRYETGSDYVPYECENYIHSLALYYSKPSAIISFEEIAQKLYLYEKFKGSKATSLRFWYKQFSLPKLRPSKQHQGNILTFFDDIIKLEVEKFLETNDDFTTEEITPVITQIITYLDISQVQIPIIYLSNHDLAINYVIKAEPTTAQDEDMYFKVNLLTLKGEIRSEIGEYRLYGTFNMTQTTTGKKVAVYIELPLQGIFENKSFFMMIPINKKELMANMKKQSNSLKISYAEPEFIRKKKSGIVDITL